MNLITNVKINELNFNYEIYRWACRTPVFNVTDPFVVEHRFNYKFLEKYLIQHKYNSLSNFKGFREYVDLCKNSWTHSVAIRWNNWVKRTEKGNVNYKVEQLYLWGPTNVGKSWFIEKLIGRNNLKYVFMPGVGKFFMQGFNSEVHKVILFEEFTYKFYHSAMLKRLLEGRPYAYPVKCELDKKIKFNGPIIFVSNFNIYDDCNDEALLGRLINIYADCRLDYGTQALCSNIKYETETSVSESEILEVSSTL